MARRTVRIGDATFAQGEPVMLHGNRGAICEGIAKAVSAPLADLLERLAVLREQRAKAA